MNIFFFILLIFLKLQSVYLVINFSMLEENAGFGYGTPAQRQKQYQKYRAVRANEAVFEHRLLISLKKEWCDDV